MNLHGLASGFVSSVNPLVEMRVRISDGYATNPDRSRTPQYKPDVVLLGQVQSLTFRDLQQIDGLNLQGIRRAIYFNGRIDGLVRSQKKGGDLVVGPDNQVWLVAMVLEYWPDWCKVAVTLQDDNGGCP
jgi:hypothetical protein